MANKKINQLVAKTTIQSTDLFPIGDATTGTLFKKTIADLQAAIGGAVISVNGLVGTVVLDTDDILEAVSPTNKYFTEARARAAISLTTTGSSGASTYSSSTGVLNVPTYTLAGLGGITAAFLSGGTGITYDSGTGVISYSGTVYTDSSVRGLFSAGTGMSYNSSTGQFSTTITQYTDALARAAISGTAPITYNSSTGAIGITQASGSTNGYLSSTDWTTFNSKQSALTNPITGTGSTNYVAKFTGTSALGNSNIQDSGSLITLGSNTTISSGSLGIGTSSLTSSNLSINKNITGSAFPTSVLIQGAAQSDATSLVIYVGAYSSTQATTFTVPNLRIFNAAQGTIGAGSTVTNQYGFFADSTLTGATNNYGFYGNLAASTGRWNLYMNGTANNYMAGALGIGSTSLTGISVNVAKTITGGVSATGIYSTGVVQSDVTNSAAYFNTSASTAAASYTVGSITHYLANQGTIGAGSTVTNQYGFRILSSLIGATNNYGFYGDIASGTGRWNLYMNGTANNYLAGSLSIGTTTSNEKLEIYASTSAAAFINLTGNANTSGTSCVTIGQNSDDGGYFWNRKASFLSFGTSNTERVRITSGGAFAVGNPGNGTGYGIEILNTFNQPRMALVDNATYTGVFKSNGLIVTLSNDSANALTLNTTAAERMRITAGGNILMGTTTDNGERLYVSGNIRATGTITANSDINLKKNLLKIENALEKVEQINGYTYEFKENDSKRHAGVIAQEIQGVLPEIVTKGNDGILGVEYGNISALLIEAIKEQQAQINELKALLNK